MTIVFADPAVVDLVNRDRVQVMQFFAAVPDNRYEIRFLQQQEVLRHRLARHGQVAAQLIQRLAAFAVQDVQQTSAAFVGEGFKHCIHADL